MANFHNCVKVFKRSKGQAATAAAAYRSGSRIYDKRLGMWFDYSHRSDVVFSKIYLPDGADESLKDRSRLWNLAEGAEKRADAQVSREVEISLPNELDFQAQKNLLYHYVQDNFVAAGMIADVNFHAGLAEKEGKEDNPHAHIQLTMRRAEGDRFDAKKEREWNKRINVEKWREDWAKKQNQEFERLGLDVRVDHRSYERQGLDQLPTIHLGYGAAKMEAVGKETERGDYNRRIAAYNMELNTSLHQLQHQIDALKAEMGSEDSESIFTNRVVLYDGVSENLLTPDPMKEIESPTLPENNLAQLRAEYFQIALFRHQNQRAGRVIDEAIGENTSQIEDLRERQALLAQYDSRLAEIEQEKGQVTGFSWGERQDLAGASERVRTARNQAVETLKYDYEIAPEQISEKVEERQVEIARLTKEREALPDGRAESEREKEIEAEYQRQLQNSREPYPERGEDEQKAYLERGLNEQVAIDEAELRLQKFHESDNQDKERGKEKDRERGQEI